MKVINITWYKSFSLVDLDVLSILAVSQKYNICYSQLMPQLDRYQLGLVYLTKEHGPVRNFQHKI